VFELDPLGARELADAGRLEERGHAARILRGGYPELWREPRLTPGDFFTSYVATYLERDVRNLARVGSLRDFERFLRACALRTGQLLNLSDLSRDLGIAQSTAREWLSVLETSGTVTLLEPWSGNLGLRLVKSPKLYANDTGLACFLLGIDSPEQLLRSPFLGPLWETWVLRQILIAKHARRRAAGVFFFRDTHGLEVDFVIDAGGSLSLVGCKWAENVGADAGTIGSMQQLARKLGPANGGRHRLACRTPLDHALTQEIRAVDPDAVDDWFA
jgi:predicted AAA+ superfamily ATPase